MPGSTPRCRGTSTGTTARFGSVSGNAMSRLQETTARPLAPVTILCLTPAALLGPCLSLATGLHLHGHPSAPVPKHRDENTDNGSVCPGKAGDAQSRAVSADKDQKPLSLLCPEQGGGGILPAAQPGASLREQI